MYIRHLEQNFSTDKVVPVDLFRFLADTIIVLRIYPDVGVLFYGSHKFLEAINFLVDPYY